MSLLQVNPYKVNQFKSNVRTREIAQQIYKAFGPVTLDFLPWFSADAACRPNYRPYSYISEFVTNLDIRENYLISPLNRLFNISIFYYIEFLKELNPERIVDIGCSTNILKKVCSNIYGISDNTEHANLNANHPGADKIEPFNHAFIKKYENQFQCAMAINSLHFIPISEFEQRVLDFVNVIKPGGRGFITFSILRSIECSSSDELIKLFQTNSPTQQQIASYVDQKIRNMPFNFLVIENLVECVKDDPINGNIRLVFQKD